MLRVVFALFILVSTCSASCPQYWYGPDCSVFTAPAEASQSYVSSVPTTKWKYYVINVDGPLEIQATMTQADSDSEKEDLDFFIQKDTFPTFTSHLDKDISTSQTSTVTVREAHGTYYVGIYGFRGGEYTFSYSLSSSCRCASTRGGQCAAGSFECTCFTGYTGEFCNISYVKVESGQQNAKVNALGWYYYSIDIPTTPHHILFELMLGGEGEITHEADLYVANGRIPTTFDFDYKTIDTGDTSVSIQISQPSAPATYYFGVYAKSISTYFAKATVFPIGSSCTNECSKHGSCSSGHCNCGWGFSGLSCEFMDTSLSLNQKQTGFVDRGAWNFFWIRVNSNSNLVAYLEQTSENSDCDLYIKQGAQPNFFNYDYFDFTTNNDYYVTIPNPGESEWHFGVYGFAACNFELSVQEAVNCGCKDNSHGSCEVGSTVCVCQEGWGGFDCVEPLTVLTSGVAMKDLVVERNGWKYFSLRIPKSIAMSIAVKEAHTEGFIWLFADFTTTPTLSSHDYDDRESYQYHQIDVIDDYVEKEIFFGVFGSPYAEGKEIIFDIVAWHAPF